MWYNEWITTDRLTLFGSFSSSNNLEHFREISIGNRILNHWKRLFHYSSSVSQYDYILKNCISEFLFYIVFICSSLCRFTEICISMNPWDILILRRLFIYIQSIRTFNSQKNRGGMYLWIIFIIFTNYLFLCMYAYRKCWNWYFLGKDTKFQTSNVRNEFQKENSDAKSKWMK